MRPRVRLPISCGMLIVGQGLIPTWGSGGRALWLCLGMSEFFFIRSVEVFANGSGVVHPAHYLTPGDVALFSVDKSVAAPPME